MNCYLTILRTDYIKHIVLFSEALWLLLQRAPSVADVSKAEGVNVEVATLHVSTA